MRSIVTFLLILPLLPCAGLDAATDATPPNLLVILADDQGWGDLSLHGNHNLATPRLDRLAREGAQFANFYVQPVCSPTRAEFLTGRYYPRGGVYDTGAGGERLDADEETIAEVFQSAGYATGAFGKWHNGTQAPYHPNTRGFDEYYGFTSGHWGSYFDALIDHNGALADSEGFLPNALTDQAIDFIQNRSASAQPFFAFLSLPTPHSPMQTTDEDWARFKDKELVQRATDPDLEDLDHTRAALALVENIDWNVGRVLDRIQDLGIADNTIVAYFSDNGPNGWRWNGDMRGRKGSTDEGGTRSPLFIRWPGRIAPGSEIETIAASIDLLPTLGALAGISWSPKKPLDGISLAPALTGSRSAFPERSLFSYWSGRVSVRTQTHRLDPEGRLYHIPSDRAQRQDLSPKQPALAAELKRQVAAWQTELLTPARNPIKRPLTIGYPGLALTQLPARDATWSGAIRRSNRWPNCSYLENWSRDSDRIAFSADVGRAGAYRATLYYTAPNEAAGTQVQLAAGEASTAAPIARAHNPPAYGMEYDRVPREESYVKDWAPLELGAIDLPHGPVSLTLQTLGLPRGAAIEFRLLLLEKR